MKMYFAGSGMTRSTLIRFRKEKVEAKEKFHFLQSYLEVKDTNYDLLTLHLPEPDQIFLDSGAYTAYTQGTNIDIYDYIRVIRESGVKVYANLDVIGQAEPTHKNYLIMKKEGLNPMPVFHKGEDIKYLTKYLEESDYVALGGLVGYSPSKLIPFLDYYFSIIKKYWPIKIHGFGLSSLRLWERYPFYSVDSTSWVAGGKFRRIIKFKDRRFTTYAKKDGASSKNLGTMKAIASPYEELNISNMEEYQKGASYVTDLWKSRGMVW